MVIQDGWYTGAVRGWTDGETGARAAYCKARPPRLCRATQKAGRGGHARVRVVESRWGHTVVWGSVRGCVRRGRRDGGSCTAAGALQLESLRGRPRFLFAGAASAAGADEDDAAGAALVLASPSFPFFSSAAEAGAAAGAAGSGSGFLRGRPRFFLGGSSEGSPPSAFFSSSSGFRWIVG